MRKINKGDPPEYFAALAAIDPIPDWGITRDISYMLRSHMLKEEQGGLCAYTEMRISAHASSSHIDHFRKRSLFRELTFDYNNLVVSCNSEFFSAKYKDKRCRPADYELLINPVTENPRDHLQYTFTGKVIPRAHSERGARTIELLNLNHPALVERRKHIALLLSNPRYSNLHDQQVIRLIGEMDSFILAMRRKFRARIKL